MEHDRQTTLITGASSGIGAEFARQLTARGSNVILVARRIDRLEALAEGLREAHDVEVSTIAADLSEGSPGETLLAETRSRGLQVTSVVNNAGFGSWGRFHETGPEQLRRMVAVDVTAVMDISRAFITDLRAHGNGYLLNVTSVAAYASFPNQAVYSATKAFVLSFTEALWAETRGTGLRVLAFAPGATDTEYFEVVGSDAADGGSRRQSPATVVENALRVLDRDDPPPSAVSGRLNHLITVAPRFLTRRRAVSVTAATTLRDR